VKKICLIAIVVLCGLNLQAQTNALASSTQIDSDTADFDMNAHTAIYRGNVHVEDPQMKLDCEQLAADLPQSGGHINHIVAETNVVIDFTDDHGQTNHVTSDKAVYIYNEQDGLTNETVTLTGNPEVKNAQGTMTADVIVWNRATSHFSFTNPHGIFYQNVNSMNAATNSSPANTNKLSAPK
jgi:lipopolysaccharide transport protein LptA